MDKLLIITGQTATGKTDLALNLAKKYNGELVSFDSRQAYKNLDIITGKEYQSKLQNSRTPELQKTEIPINMYDIYDPKEIITAFDYCQKAEIIIQDILKRGKLPIIVGGTVFYIKSFLYGVSDYVGEPDWDLRNELENKTVADLQNILKKIDEKILLAMNNSDVNNKRRLIRRIEIGKNTPIIQYSNTPKNEYNSLIIGLYREKEELVDLISKRVKKRIAQGAFVEIENLLKDGYSFSNPGLNTIGYKQLSEFFTNKKPKEEAIKNWEMAETDYARRQLVFAKKLKNINLFSLSQQLQLEKINDLVYKWLYAKS